MSYDILSSVSQNVLKFYQHLSFLVGTISNVLVMEIGWTDVGSGGYILVVSSTYANILKYHIQGMPTNIILQVFI